MPFKIKEFNEILYLVIMDARIQQAPEILTARDFVQM